MLLPPIDTNRSPMCAAAAAACNCRVFHWGFGKTSAVLRRSRVAVRWSSNPSITASRISISPITTGRRRVRPRRTSGVSSRPISPPTATN